MEKVAKVSMFGTFTCAEGKGEEMDAALAAVAAATPITAEEVR